MHILLAAALAASIAQVNPAEHDRMPQVASAPGLTAITFASGNSIWFAASHDDGQSFATPIEVANVPVLAVGRHRGPHLVISGKTVIVSAVYGNTAATGPHAHGLPSDGDLVAWRSEDEGYTWSKPSVINDVAGAAREGLHAMAAGSRGELAAVWLDLRSKGTRLYGAYSKDNGATWSKNIALYESPAGTICQCCAPSIVFSKKHVADVMFRNVIEDCRDMYLAEWNLGGALSNPRKLAANSWKINACPMDGGGLVSDGKSVAAAWRSDKTVYLAESGRPEVPLGEGKDVAIANSAKGPYVAWVGESGIEVHKPGQPTAVPVSTGGAFPVVAATPRGTVLLAWEQDGKIEVLTF